MKVNIQTASRCRCCGADGAEVKEYNAKLLNIKDIFFTDYELERVPIYGILVMGRMHLFNENGKRFCVYDFTHSEQKSYIKKSNDIH